jgi:hypothetical protein
LKKTIIKREKRQLKKEGKIKYIEWVKAVKERDNYTCQISGKYLKDADPRALQAAHILSKENYPELKYDIMNGISLSYYYHKNAPISSHLDGFAFALWLMKNKPEQFKYLTEFLEKNKKIKEKEN